MNNQIIIIVHPFVSDKFLYKTIKERGYKIITLITQFDQNWIKLCMDTINKYSDFTLNVTNDICTDIVSIQKILNDNQLKLKGVINAFDYSLEYSDSLTNKLLDANINLKYSKIRCNKYDVNEELANNSALPTIKSILIKNEPNWQDSLGGKLLEFKYPVIIKPASDSAARNDMAQAENINEVIKYLDRLFTRPGTFSGQSHLNFIIQEYIHGEEFFVNSVAMNGQSKTVGVFKYKKDQKKHLGLVSLSDENENKIQSLLNYHNQCMQHLCFSYGMVHSEYIIDTQGQPYLIEVNNRLAGADVPYLSNKCYHNDEVNLFLDLLENKKEITEFSLQKIFSYAAVPYLYNYNNPHATKLNLSFIASEHGMILFRKPEAHLNQDNGEVFDKPAAAIWLVNDDQVILTKDLRHLRDLEAIGKLFV
jgi:predicted ATP-grasp superfamily ATP-dependent carboligase